MQRQTLLGHVDQAERGHDRLAARLQKGDRGGVDVQQVARGFERALEHRIQIESLPDALEELAARYRLVRDPERVGEQVLLVLAAPDRVEHVPKVVPFDARSLARARSHDEDDRRCRSDQRARRESDKGPVAERHGGCEHGRFALCRRRRDT